MAVNFSVIAYKNKNDNVIVIAEGDRTDLTKILPTVKEAVPSAKLIPVDENDYNNCKNDIEEHNEFLSAKM